MLRLHWSQVFSPALFVFKFCLMFLDMWVNFSYLVESTELFLCDFFWLSLLSLENPSQSKKRQKSTNICTDSFKKYCEHFFKSLSVCAHEGAGQKRNWGARQSACRVPDEKHTLPQVPHTCGIHVHSSFGVILVTKAVPVLHEGQ